MLNKAQVYMIEYEVERAEEMAKNPENFLHDSIMQAVGSANLGATMLHEEFTPGEIITCKSFTLENVNTDKQRLYVRARMAAGTLEGKPYKAW